MGFFIIIGLLLWGWAEMTAFIFIGNKIGGLLTFLGVFVTAFIGIVFLKKQGFSVLKRIRNELASGHTPIASIAESVSLVAGGILMLSPGYVTDAIGFLFFIPGFRTIAGMYLVQWIANSRQFKGSTNLNGGSFTQGKGHYTDMNSQQEPFSFPDQERQPNVSDDIIEGEFTEQPDPKSGLH